VTLGIPSGVVSVLDERPDVRWGQPFEEGRREAFGAAGRAVTMTRRPRNSVMTP
jgi:hypothetical protein